jgi:sugar/nucleoside kinase (ribokinase family)
MKNSADPARFDVLGIGNALVDVLVQADEAFLARHGMEKGSMELIDAERARSLYEAMPPATEMSGGSAANTIAGVASLGGRAAYVGKVSGDQLGDVFAHDIRSLGVAFENAPARDSSTGRCLIFVTADAQRTMQTFLGAAADLSPADVDPAFIGAASVTFLEGYLFDPPPAKDAFVKASQSAHAAGRRVALTLSDAFCVERHREAFQDLVEHHVDILLANESEIRSLYEVGSFDEALQIVRETADIAALTRSERGSVVVSGDEIHIIDGERIGPVVDTTGAGDMYAAGFLYGLTHGHDLRTAGRIASICAGEVISHFGARPQTRLSELVQQRLR